MTEFEEIVKRDLLTTKGDLIYIQPSPNAEIYRDFQVFPINDYNRAILLTLEQYKGLIGGVEKINNKGKHYQIPKYQLTADLKGIEPYVEGDK